MRVWKDFSLIRAQWSKERTRQIIDSVKGVIFVKFNFKQVTFTVFCLFVYLMYNNELSRRPPHYEVSQYGNVFILMFHTMVTHSMAQQDYIKEVHLPLITHKNIVS